MAAGSFDVSISVGEIEDLAETLLRIDGESLGRASVRAVNAVTQRTFDQARERMIQGIALSETYVRDRMAVREATDPGRPVATITARYRHTTLGTYGARQETQPVKNPKRSKGDPLRGIPRGMKAAGVSVEVTRGRRKTLPHAFLVPQRVGRDSGGRLNVFTREGDRLFMRYGPSVYQLFRHAVAQMQESIERDLRDQVIAEAKAEINKVLG